MENLRDLVKAYSLVLFSVLVIILGIGCLGVSQYLGHRTVVLEIELEELRYEQSIKRAQEQPSQEIDVQVHQKITGKHNYENLTHLFTGLGYSFLASLVFAFAYSRIVEKHNIGFISQEVAEYVQAKVYEQIRQRFIDVVPENFFPASTDPDDKFNAILLNSLKTSNLYLFKGVTGRHIPDHIRKINYTSFSAVRILLLDPSNEEYLTSYCEERFGKAAVVAQKAALVEQIRQEIREAITGLHGVAKVVPLEIAFHHGPIFYRTEIFDEMMLISFFQDYADTPYPDTYQYLKSTIFYQAFLKDFHQGFSNSRVVLSFDKTSSDTNLNEALLTVFGFTRRTH